MENVHRLEYKGKELILVGTAHVSHQSAELVEQVIAEEQPDSVCIEMDEGRYQNMKNPSRWEETDIVQVIRQKKTGFMLANLILGAYQKRMAKTLDIQVGQEMRQGADSSEAVGASLVLADRNIQTTFLRIWRKLGFVEKCKLIASLVFSFGEDEDITEDNLQELMQQDILESALTEVRGEFPMVADVLIHERDQHLAVKIREAPGPKVVAVVGGAHVPGIREEIYKEQDLEEITTVPPKGKLSKIISWAIPVAIVALIVYGFVVSVQTGIGQITSWVLWNAVLAALFTLIARGHPLTILTAGVAAPFTSLHPLIPVGLVSGLVEATIRKPTVKDLSTVSDDIFSFKRFFKNRFLRILLVVVMSNLGSAIGTIVAGLGVIRALF